MSVLNERRSGRDRREPFLAGLDRRQNLSQRNDQLRDAALTRPERAVDASTPPRQAENYWGAGDTVPPVE